MHSIKLNSHVGDDGILQLQVPVGIANADLEVMIIVQPLPTVATNPPSQAKTPEELGYSREFLEVLGSWEGTLERPEQLPYEEREEIRWDTF
jgi:hypothetical protein